MDITQRLITNIPIYERDTIKTLWFTNLDLA